MTRSTVGAVARSYWKIRKVSADQMISPVDGFHPKLPVWLSRCASARYASLRCSARRWVARTLAAERPVDRMVSSGIADSVGRDRLSSAGVRFGTLAPRPRSSRGRAPDGLMGERTFHPAPSYHQCECPAGRWGPDHGPTLATQR